MPSQSVKAAAALGDEVLQLDPEWSEGYLMKGSALTLQLSFAEAEKVLRTGELKCGGVRTARLSAALGLLAKMRLESVMDTPATTDAPPDGASAPAEAASGGLAPEGDKFDGLEAWLASDKDGNSRFPKLYMKKYMEGNRGVHCREDIPVCTRAFAGAPRQHPHTASAVHRLRLRS